MPRHRLPILLAFFLAPGAFAGEIRLVPPGLHMSDQRSSKEEEAALTTLLQNLPADWPAGAPLNVKSVLNLLSRRLRMTDTGWQIVVETRLSQERFSEVSLGRPITQLFGHPLTGERLRRLSCYDLLTGLAQASRMRLITRHKVLVFCDPHTGD